ncbi:MAG TPA: NAD-dependent epimerase/dehydratase family protein [Longimicrobiales bacterium]
MTTRRDFVRTAALATSAAAVAPRHLSAVLASPRALRILILGGTGFLGPYLVHNARQRGHSVSILTRGRREPGLFESDFEGVEHLIGDRNQPNGLDALKGKKWDVVIETSGYRHPWTRESAQALKGSVGRYMYVSSTGVYWPYHTVDIDESGRVLLADNPPTPEPTYGVMKALSENEVKSAFGNNAIIVRPGYIVGPGDTSDRWTYWPVRVMRGGEIMVPGNPTDQVQYIDVRDLTEWMIRMLENGTTGTFNAVGPARKQTMQEFVYGLAALTPAPLSWTWIQDNDWLKNYPLRKLQNGTTEGLLEAVPWIMPLPDELGHMRAVGRKAIDAGLTFRPLAVTAQDTITWRASDDVPAALRQTPRYVMSAEDEARLLAAWKNR